MLPTREQERELHRRPLSGERAIADDIVSLYLPPLHRSLCKTFPTLASTGDLEECVLDACMDYFVRPHAYCAEACSLFGYLRLASRRNALNLWEKLQRRQHDVALDENRVADQLVDRNTWVERVLGEVPGLPEGVTVE